MNTTPEKVPPRLLTHSSDSSPQLRRAISLRSRQTLRSLRPADREKEERPRARSRPGTLSETPQNGLTASAPMERPKKSRKKKLRQRLSLSLRGSDKNTQEDIANLQREVKECNAKISIGEDVAFSHKEHVGKDDANQFLLRLLKLREESSCQEEEWSYQEAGLSCPEGVERGVKSPLGVRNPQKGGNR